MNRIVFWLSAYHGEVGLRLRSGWKSHRTVGHHMPAPGIVRSSMWPTLSHAITWGRFGGTWTTNNPLMRVNLSRSVKMPESINASYWSTVKRASGNGSSRPAVAAVASWQWTWSGLRESRSFAFGSGFSDQPRVANLYRWRPKVRLSQPSRRTSDRFIAPETFPQQPRRNPKLAPSPLGEGWGEGRTRYYRRINYMPCHVCRCQRERLIDLRSLRAIRSTSVHDPIARRIARDPGYFT